MDAHAWNTFVSSFDDILIPGLTMTIPITAAAFALCMVVALALALVQYAKVPVARQFARFYIWVFRGTPLLVQLLLVYYGLPDLGVMIPKLAAAIAVIGLNYAAYCAETIRAALEAVPIGQVEAGYCAGLTYMQIMRRIVLPQAMRTAFPPLSNSLISMLKDTSLAANITVMEMLQRTRQIIARTYEPLALYTEVALIYLAFSTILTWLQGVGERRLSQHRIKNTGGNAHADA